MRPRIQTVVNGGSVLVKGDGIFILAPGGYRALQTLQASRPVGAENGINDGGDHLAQVQNQPMI